jgi:putative tryptophan/tyrosine transport system substrate-binding protein
VKRREFVTLICGAAAAWPLAAHAQQQQAAMSVVGWLGSETREAEDFDVVAFREGLKEGGYSEGQSVTIEYRFADGHYDRLPALAADLVHRPVNVIALTGQPAALAAKAATTTISIIFQIADDPVQLGLVASLSRPGGNMTGVTSLNVELLPKQLELLHELVPTATVMAIVVNPASPVRAESNTKQAQVAARRLGLKLHVLHASSEQDFDAALANAIQLRAGALVIGTDSTLGFILAGHCAYWSPLLDSERCGLRRQLGGLLQGPQRYRRLLAFVYNWSRKIFDRCIASHRRA